MGKLNIKKNIQVSKPMFLTKYGSLALYDDDLKKVFIIEHEILQFNKNDGWNLILILEKENGTFSDHEYFYITDDIFDWIQSTHQDRNILWEFMSNGQNENESQSEAREIHNDKIKNKKRTTTKYSTNHTLQRKRQNKVDCRKKTFDDFRLMVVEPPPKLNSEESDFHSSYFGISNVNQ